ncbi:MAG: riboflavin synthase [Chloroflexi bacterium]|nr:riboflavin synthase [Chloroflexota bacterium]
MFTGIVEETGTILAAEPAALTVACSTVLEGTREGDSVAINGVCLTVVERAADRFTVEMMPETMRRTNLGDLRVGDRVNLERAVTPQGRMGGHFVQGHVEATGQIESFTPDGNAVVVRVAVPAKLLRYIVPQGFIAVDGVSLTVVGCEASSFWFSLIPYTQTHVAILDKRPGDRLNLETDILAKYVERCINATRDH